MKENRGADNHTQAMVIVKCRPFFSCLSDSEDESVSETMRVTVTLNAFRLTVYLLIRSILYKSIYVFHVYIVRKKFMTQTALSEQMYHKK